MLEWGENGVEMSGLGCVGVGFVGGGGLECAGSGVAGVGGVILVCFAKRICAAKVDVKG